MWSRPIPLGWYFQPQWLSQYGTNWASAMCDNWLMDDRYLKNFASDVAQCPCTLSQALIDKGRFMPDFDCDIDRNPQCPYNKGAVHCVMTGSPRYVLLTNSSLAIIEMCTVFISRNVYV